jgi:hypothetical protein
VPKLVRGNFMPAQWAQLSERTKSEILKGAQVRLVNGSRDFCDKYEFGLRRAINRPGVTVIVQPEYDEDHGAMIHCIIYVVDAAGANLVAERIIEPWDVFPSDFATTQILLITGASFNVDDAGS